MITIFNPLPATTPGRCRYCRCTDALACDDGCTWLDTQHTVCSSSECVQRWAFALARLLPQTAERRRNRQRRKKV
jgi:hypothetical protein